jgi:hypothetical protein
MQNMHLKVEWREISFHWQDVRIIVVGAVVFFRWKTFHDSTGSTNSLATKACTKGGA